MKKKFFLLHKYVTAQDDYFKGKSYQKLILKFCYIGVVSINIVDFLGEKDLTFEITYYAENDLATNHDLNILEEAHEEVSRYFMDYEISGVMSEDNFVDYLFAEKTIRMRDTLPRIIDEEIREKINVLIQIVGSFLSTVNKGMVIRFLNTNYMSLLQREDEMKKATLKLMQQYVSGLSPTTLLYLTSNEGFFIFDNYDSFKKAIEKDDSLLESLFSDENMQELFPSQVNMILRILENMNRKPNPFLKKIVNQVIEYCIGYGELLVRVLTLDNALYYQQEIDTLYAFFKRISHVQANTFLKYKKKADSLVNEHIDKFGQESRFEIPIAKYLKRLLKNPQWPQSILSLTHVREKSGTYKSYLANQLSSEIHLIDLVSTTFPTDYYFTFTNQDFLKHTLLSRGGLLYGCVREDVYFPQLKSWYAQSIQAIVAAIEPIEDNMVEDTEVLIEFLNGIHSSMRQDSLVTNSLTRALSYGAATYICVLSEKLLRNFYFYISKEDIFIQFEKVTLGDLLNGNERSVFSDYHKKHLRYFLSTDGEKRIGLELRNKLVHWRGLSWERVDTLLVFQLLYLFTDIINTILVEILPEKENPI